MTRSSPRSGRVGDLLHRELAKLIRDKCSDPRVGMVTISGVAVTDDLSFARVYITVLDDQRQKETVDVLNGAAGFFRTQLSKNWNTRVVPKIQFIYDNSLATGNRIDMLLNSVKPRHESEE